MSLRRHAAQPFNANVQAAAPAEVPEDIAPWDAGETADAPQVVPASQAVQTVQNAGRPAAPANTTSFSVEALAQEGYEGLSLDFNSFPVISLKTNGQFVDSDNTKYGTEFKCRVHMTKEKYVYRGLTNGKVLDNKKDVAYSYDQDTTTRGEKVDLVIGRWKAEGKTWDQKKYLEALVQMEAPGTPYDGEFRMLSISPTSVGRLTGFLLTVKMQLKGAPLASQLVRIYCGQELQVNGQSFYPWGFAKA